MKDLKRQALKYAKQGLKIFPLKPQSKAPLTKNGFKDATNDINQIETWWTEYPNANIGLLTGKENGLFALDIDGAYPDTFPPLPARPTVKTHKGYHYYFQYPENETVKTQVKIQGHDVDLKSDGGYIVAPPSIHPKGGRYEFIS